MVELKDGIEIESFQRSTRSNLRPGFALQYKCIFANAMEIQRKNQST